MLKVIPAGARGLRPSLLVDIGAASSLIGPGDLASEDLESGGADPRAGSVRPTRSRWTPASHHSLTPLLRTSGGRE